MWQMGITLYSQTRAKIDNGDFIFDLTTYDATSQISTNQGMVCQESGVFPGLGMPFSETLASKRMLLPGAA